MDVASKIKKFKNRPNSTGMMSSSRKVVIKLDPYYRHQSPQQNDIVMAGQKSTICLWLRFKPLYKKPPKIKKFWSGFHESLETLPLNIGVKIIKVEPRKL